MLRARMLEYVKSSQAVTQGAGLAALAASQGGPFTVWQARAAGYSAGQIRYLAQTGQWIVLRRGVYAAAGLLAACQDDAHRHAIDVAAAILALCPPGLPPGRVVGSHHSAARVLGVDLLDRPAIVTLIRSPDAPASGSYAPGVLVRRAALPAGHLSARQGVPISAPARTVVDLARTLPFMQGVVAADAALRARLTNQPELRNMLEACRCWPGIRKAGQVVEFADPWAESVFESVARVVFAEQKLPPPQTQVPIIDSAKIIARVDFLWEKYHTIAEADGMLKYTSTAVLRAEKLRQERLADLGYEIVRITWRQITEHPEETVARIRRAFGRGSVKAFRTGL
jgi:Transcriptional regulator, AbiEi antitoxin